jgi:hypothetical protein
LSDFQLLFHSDTYHYVPPPPPPPPLAPPAIAETSAAAAAVRGEGEVEESDDDSSIPDFEEFVEKAISDFISKDGFDEGDDDDFLIRRSRRPAEPSVPTHDEVNKFQQRSQSPPLAEVPPPTLTTFHPPRKMRSLLSLISSLPSALHLSSSHSLDLQLHKLSEALVSSSIIALHHLLKFDPYGKVSLSLSPPPLSLIGSSIGLSQ